MRRSALLLVLAACSNGSTPADGGADVGTSDVIAPNDAGASDADADAAQLSVPAALDQASKVALWLEATSADLSLADGGIATWRDKSKNKNDAIAASASPTVESAAIAGHDAVHFGSVGGGFTLADAPSLRFAVDQIFIIAVTKVKTLRSSWFYKIPDGGNGLEFFTANGGSLDGGAFILSPFGEINATGIQWGTAELNDGNFHIVTFRRTAATSIEVAVDDIAPRSTTVTADDVSEPGTPAGIGGLLGPAADYSIAEELVIHDSSGTVADADAASLHAYLKQKYAL